MRLAFVAVLCAVALPALAISLHTEPSVFFGANRTDLSLQGLASIKIAVQDFEREPRGTRVGVVGHTDTAERDRLALSQRRAEAVKDALVREGIPAEAIITEGRGDSRLLVPTKEGVGEPQNRRAEIYFIPP